MDSGLRADQQSKITTFDLDNATKSEASVAAVTSFPRATEGLVGAGFPRELKSTARPKLAGKLTPLLSLNFYS
jgi:hypothetical protein